MKQKSLLRKLFLLCALVAGSISAGATEVTFTAGTDQGSNGTSGTSDTMTKSGITISGTSFATTTTEYRIYSGSTLTISSSLGNITQIVFNCTANKGSDYGPDKISTTTGTYTTTTGSKVGTWTGSAVSVSFTASAQCRATSIIVTYTPSSSDPSSNVSFANETPTLDLKDASSYTQTATTASGYSTTPGASVTYSITTNTAGATIDENTGEVTPSHTGSVTVEASAAAIDGHFAASTATYTLTVTDTREFTITCHIGNNTSNVVRVSGATLSLETPAAIGGMSFAGWSSTNDVAAPVWVTNTTAVTSNMELYAMYLAVAGEYSYHLVETNQADWRGDYLIAYSSTVFADGRVGGTGTGGIGANAVKVNPGTKLSGNIVDITWGDTYNITLEAINDNRLSDGYLMVTKDGKYNYHTSNSNGLTTTTTRATAAAYPISITFTSSSDVKLCLGGNAQGAVFRYNSGSGGYFRFYKDGGQNAVYLYKRTADVEPVYSLGLTATLTLSSSCTDGANYYGTYSNSSAFVVPAGLTVSAITGTSGATLTLNDYTTGDVVPANTGVLVSSTTAGEKTVVLTNEAGTAKVGNMLKPSSETMTGDNKFYRLTMHNGSQLGFWWGAADGAAFTIAANKAYLAVPTAGAREGFTFGEDVTTAISEECRVKSEEFATAAMYDLQGRRVSQPRKGLYISNGRKVFVK